MRSSRSRMPVLVAPVAWPTPPEERFEVDLPEQLNQAQRFLLVAQSVGVRTDRIVRCLAETAVPACSTARMPAGTDLITQVYLIEPEPIQPMERRTSVRSGYRTVNELQALSDEKGIGET